MKESISILKSEHRSISAVLLGLKHLAEMAQDAHLKPDFKVFRSMLRYIDEYPERLHHPKEDEHLFARLAARWPEAGKLVEDLKAEHVQGAHLIRELERRLVFFEEGWPEGAAEFLGGVNRRAAAAERVEHQVAGIAAGLDDPLQQRHGPGPRLVLGEPHRRSPVVMDMGVGVVTPRCVVET